MSEQTSRGEARGFDWGAQVGALYALAEIIAVAPHLRAGAIIGWTMFVEFKALKHQHLLAMGEA